MDNPALCHCREPQQPRGCLMSAVLDERSLAELHDDIAAFRGEVSQAVDGLVSGVLGLQNDQFAPLARRVESLERQADRLLTLSRDIQRVSQDLDLERSNRALAEMSR